MSRALSEKNKKQTIVFNHRDGFVDQKIEVPCGKCIGCRLKRSQEWAVRCTHEASMWEENVFITLTYNDENNPGSLSVEHFQKFIKRLRKHYPHQKIRYFAGGEYGEKTGRPHYHAILFNIDFKDKTVVNRHAQKKQYLSETLKTIWGKGDINIGDVTQESAQYVAKYVIKKVAGDMIKERYGDKTPPFGLMSRKPGIGSTWFDEFSSDIYPSDVLITKNLTKIKPPKFYDKKLAAIHSNMYHSLSRKRREQGIHYRDSRNDQGIDNVITAHIKEAQIKQKQTTL